MSKRLAGLRAIATVALMASLLTVATQISARAVDIEFLCATALKSAAGELIPTFERARGDKINATFAPISAIAERIRKGDAADLVIVSPRQWEALRKEGKLDPAVRVVIAKVGVGVFVKTGAAKPDIASVGAFKRALLNARSIAIGNPAIAAPGAYAIRLFDRLGITAALKVKSSVITTGDPLEIVAKGDAEIGLSQISRVFVPGVELVGPLPAGIQNYTIFTAAIPANARNPAAAKALIDFLTSPTAASILKSKGLTSP